MWEAMPAEAVPSYDIAGNLLFQHSMDAGGRWMLTDAQASRCLPGILTSGSRMTAASSSNAGSIGAEYDELHRPLRQWVGIDDNAAQLIESFSYGEPPLEAADEERQARSSANLLGQVHRHFDPAGLTVNERFDFKGNLLEKQRQLASSYAEPVIDWSDGSPTSRLDGESFMQITEHDALSRMTRLYNWHRSIGSRVAVYEPRYNARGRARK